MSTVQSNPYDAAFWLTYGAHFLLAAAAAVLVRYGDFVAILGGSEVHLGWIVGVGTLGSLVMRLTMGMGIDLHGPRLIWLGSAVLFAIICFAHLFIASHNGWAIYALRIAYCCAMSGIYGASLTFISGRSPVARMAEMVGMIGTGGFLGSIAGSQLGDHLRGTGALERWQLDQMFVAAGLLALAAIPVTWLALRGHEHPRPAPGPAMFGLLRSYHPGMLLAVVVVMGACLNLPSTFLATYAADLRIERIALFFTAYAIAAVTTRVLTRRWPQRYGLRAMILLGIAGLLVSQLLFLFVRHAWDLWLPGVGYGMTHAVLFPATVAAGNRWFPERHRGLGTILILAMWDVGVLVGMPAAGVVLHHSQALGLPPYPTLFVSGAVLAGAVGGWYVLSSRPALEQVPKILPSHAPSSSRRKTAKSAITRR